MKSLFVAILRKICRAGIIIPHRHKVLRSLVSELPPNAQPLCLTCSGEPFSALENSSALLSLKIASNERFQHKMVYHAEK